MSDQQVSFSDDAVWCEPNLEWTDIDRLRLSLSNPWVEFSLLLNRALINRWDGDFLICPYIFRSPMDAASGLRGSEFFTDLYENPQRCKRLINWCTDWNIAIRRYLEDQVEYPDGCHQGVWSTWLPRGSVFVNGDPVDMISREMQAEFDAPFTGRLFSELSGGFFHHHALGLYQVDRVAQTDGILVQEVLPDPGLSNPVETILNDPAVADRCVEASRYVPLMLKNVPNALLPELIAVFKGGRVILWLEDSSPPAIDAARRIVEAA